MEKYHQALLWEKYEDEDNLGSVRCRLCSHYCIINDGGVGECLTRKNISGELFTTTYAMAQSAALDPIEKKPFYHFKPGSSVLSFGSPGCNFRCQNCQNWDLSQSYRLDKSRLYINEGLQPERILELAIGQKADGISYTYSEPTIFFEYARDTILAQRRNPKAENMFHVFVSNGYLSKEAMDMIEKEKLISAINIDLKFMDDEKYQRICGARLKPVLDSIKRVNELKEWLHLEIINLVIPGENDSDSDLRRLCEFVCSVSPEIPLHFSRFFPQYQLSHIPPTSPERLLRAREIAKETGLEYIYTGNIDLPGSQDTLCPKCKSVLISRSRYGIIINKFKESNNPVCASCGEKINIVL